MNFQGAWGALQEPVTYFWKIAVPVTAFILLVVVLPHVSSMFVPKPVAVSSIKPRQRQQVKWKLSSKRKRSKPRSSASPDDAHIKEEAAEETGSSSTGSGLPMA